MSSGLPAASVTPESATKVYGSADPVLRGTLLGFQPADGATLTFRRVPGENVGIYSIVATLLPERLATSFDITYQSGLFTIVRATPIVTATGRVCRASVDRCVGAGLALGVLGETLPVRVSYRGTGATLYFETTVAPRAPGTYLVIVTTPGDGNHTAGIATAPIVIRRPISFTGTVTFSPVGSGSASFEKTPDAGRRPLF